jgi:hypothetical protein
VRSGTPARGVTFAVIAEIGTAIAITVVGGVLAVTALLLVLGATGGWATAWALRTGAGASLPDGRRVTLAVVFAVGGVVLGAVGLWLYARTEGGVLPFPDYLDQVFGPLVQISAVFAAITAWLASR